MASRGLGATAAAGLAAVALASGGCGGDGGEAVETGGATTPAPAAVAVRVADADTARPLAGAGVIGFRGREEVAREVADDAGRAELPAGTRFAEARAPGRPPARARIDGAQVRLELYDPALQSPEYGGGPDRDRFVPGVVAPPPDGPPDWSFESRTLLEFPPAVADGLAVVGNNAGRVYALDSRTGELRWARRQRGEIASSPAIAGDRVFVTSMDGAVTAYTAVAGTRVWQHTTGGSPSESSPLVVDGLVYAGAWNGRLYALDAATGRQRWAFQAADDIKGSAALAAGRIVVADYAGNVYALDPETGAERWRYTGGQRFYGGPAVSDGVVVIGDVGGAVIALDADDGGELWRHSTGGAYVYSTAAIARGTAFIGSYNGRFEALDLGTGAVRWSFDTGQRISGSATVVGDVVYTAVLWRPGEPRRTYGLDVRTGAVRFRAPEGRYSPAVAAGRTLYLVGTRTLDAYRAP